MARPILAGLFALLSCAYNEGHAAGKPRAETASPALTTAALGSATAASKYVFSAADSTVALVVERGGRHETAAFRQFEGALELVQGDMQKSLVVLTIATASLAAAEPALVAELRGAGSLDVARYPEASFLSTAIVPGGAPVGTHTVSGRLRLHGVSQMLRFPVTLRVQARSLRLEGECALDPKAFGIGAPGTSAAPAAMSLRLKLSLYGENTSK